MRSILAALVVDSDSDFRQRVQTWLVGLADVALAGTAESEPEGLVLARERQPEVMLIAIELLDGVISRPGEDLVSRYPGSRVLLLSHPDQEPLVLAALRRGAAGYLVKEEMTPDALQDALGAVSRGEAVLTPRMAGLILDQICQPQSGD